MGATAVATTSASQTFVRGFGVRMRLALEGIEGAGGEGDVEGADVAGNAAPRRVVVHSKSAFVAMQRAS